MTQSHRHVVEKFFATLPTGSISDDLLTPDMTFWSVNGGMADKARFQGAIRVLSAVYGSTSHYTITSLTAEEDRVAAETQSQGTLITGETIENNHVFLFRFFDNRIAEVREFMNQIVVRDKIVPLMQGVLQRP